MTSDGAINIGICREVMGCLEFLRGKVCPFMGIKKKEKSIDFSFFWCPGQDSNLHELMLTTPSK